MVMWEVMYFAVILDSLGIASWERLKGEKHAIAKKEMTLLVTILLVPNHLAIHEAYIGP